MNTTTQSPKFKTWQELADHLLNEMEIKLESVFVKDPTEYGSHAVYMNRVANYSKPKFRVIDTQREHVKNCIKITYNPDRYKKRYIENLLRSRINLITRFSHGSCQTCITKGIVSQVITGVNYGNGPQKEKFHAMLND